MTDERVVAEVQLPAPLDILKLARLTFNGAQCTWSLLSMQRSWCIETTKALNWLLQYVRGCTTPTDRDLCFQDPVAFITAHPGV